MTVAKGYKIALFISIFGGVAYVLLSFVIPAAMAPILVCLCRIGTTMAYNIGYVSVPKLFPTKYQSTVYAGVNLCAHLFACLGPLVAEIPAPVPMVGFVVAVTVSMLSLKTLKELEVQDVIQSTQKDQ